MTAAYPPRVWLRQSTAPRLRYAELPEQIEYISLPELRERLGKIREILMKPRYFERTITQNEVHETYIETHQALAEIDKFLEEK